MKTHFGIMQDWGDYEHPLVGCEETLCGYKGENACEYTTENWKKVTCKRCLQRKDQYVQSQKIDKEAIAKEYGDMAEFFAKEYKGVNQ